MEASNTGQVTGLIRRVGKVALETRAANAVGALSFIGLTYQDTGGPVFWYRATGFTAWGKPRSPLSHALSGVLDNRANVGSAIVLEPNRAVGQDDLSKWRCKEEERGEERVHC